MPNEKEHIVGNCERAHDAAILQVRRYQMTHHGDDRPLRAFHMHFLPII